MTRKRITTPGALAELRDSLKVETDLREGTKNKVITVHMGTCGIAAGARDILQLLADELSRAGIDDITLRQSGCVGGCSHEPMATYTDAENQTFIYGELDRAKIQEIVREHLVSHHPVQQYLLANRGEDDGAE